MKLTAEKYKQTEVGLIPSDWEVISLGEVFEFKNGLNKEKHFFGKGTPIVNYMDVFKNSGLKSGDLSGRVTLSPQEIKNFDVRKGDVFFTRTSETVEEIGISAVMLEDVKNTVFSGFVLRARPTNDKLDLEFKKYCFSTKEVRKEITSKSSYTTRALTNGRLLSAVKLAIPPTKTEQTAIAAALSDADALISSLEKLIAKKRNIKQGAMQQLLQPKEGWEVKKLGEVGKAYGGLSGKSKADFESGTYPYIPFMNIMSNPVIDTNYFDFVNINVGESQNGAQKGDLFFNGSSETPEEVGMCSVLLEDVPNLYLNSFCFGFRLNKDSKENGLYLSYFFRSIEGRKLFYSMAQGATRYNLSKSNFNKLEVKFPNPEEQTRIATILSDMDAEIGALEAKLEKYRKVKLGMMQNLLTGKIRLNQDL